MSRAEERESLKEVAIAMCAIDRILAETENDLNTAKNKVLRNSEVMGNTLLIRCRVGKMLLIQAPRP